MTMNLEKAEKTQAIAKLLGAQYCPLFTWGDKIELPNGELFIRYGGHSKKGQWQISASVPRSNEIYLSPSDRPNLVINVSETKDAATIARDIQRKLLPNLATYSANVSKRLAEHDAYSEKVKANLELAASLVDAHIESNERATFTSETWYGTIQAGSDSVKVEIRSLPIDAMKAVLETLARFK